MNKKLIFLPMVTLFAVAVVLFVSLQFVPVEKLIRPPHPHGENYEIQQAFESHVGTEYTLEPVDSIAYNFFDLDSDGTQEVIISYSSLSNSSEIVKLTVMKKVNDEWVCMSDLPSQYSDIEFLKFIDVNIDSYYEIVLGCSNSNESGNKHFIVFQAKSNSSGYSFESIYETDYYKVKVFDVNNDGFDDLVKIRKIVLDTVEKYEMSLMFYNDNVISETATVKIVPTLQSIFNIEVNAQSNNEIKKIYLDGYRDDGMIVSCCYLWNSVSKKFDLYKNSDALNGIFTARSTEVSCKDIDNDGLIEMPFETYLYDSKVISDNDYDLSQRVIVWSDVTSENSKEKECHIINTKYGYTFVFNPDWMEEYTIINDLNNGIITFYSLDKNKKRDKAIFSIFATEEKNEEYEKIYENSDYNYYLILYNEAFQRNMNNEKIIDMIEFNGVEK